MDRYNRKEAEHKVPKLKMVIVLCPALLLSIWGNTIYAETEMEKERKIELEKLEIFGVLERPNVIFPTRWKDPEGPDERVYNFKRSFKEEIFEFVDMETIREILNSKHEILNKSK